ncbi:hypothetical protein KCTC52924_01737 [Arenibacter antarcticus]|uniref:Lipoprotein n=1 Tax=Arenibacter antarcticus TaxID=2040469 RepID=A0ABW5VJD3_9FLAO|nr:hypothetical protein [Arenibacter sp. H213]MCM4166882.1 hypothetical protein [Arenibacter sp. H213]
MKHHKLITVLIISVITLGFVGCESKYTKMLNREAKKNELKDSLIFGMTLGDNKADFFKRCWQLNQEGLISQGPNNKTVKYELPMATKQESTSAITLLFYGAFNEQNTMTGMDMSFSYTAWSPWNSNLSAQHLLPIVQDTLRKWFPGNDFIKVKSDQLKNTTFVKIDGNRQIMAYAKDDKDVVVKIEDLKLKYPEKYN